MPKNPLLYLAIITVLFFSGCIISGKVIDENGAGVAGVTITLRGGDSRVVVTDSEGKYRFGDIFKEETWVAEGTYTLTPLKTGYSCSPASTDVSVTTITLEGLGDVPEPASGINFEAKCNTIHDVINIAA